MIRTNFTIIPIPICSANDPLQNLKNSCWYNLALVKHVSCCGAQRFLPGAARWAHGWPDPTAPRCQPCCEKGQRQVVMKKILPDARVMAFSYVSVVPGGDKNPRWDDPPFAAWITSCECRTHQLLYFILSILRQARPFRQEHVSQKLFHSGSLKSNLLVGLSEGGPCQV